jgi:RimJ/RimL family protein N-acetyltransferase
VIELIDATDAHFLWLLGKGTIDPGLSVPPGGVEQPDTLKMLRRMTARVREVHGTGAWIMVANGEAVGLCSYKRPAGPDGVVEIGYGVAPARRRLGHATHAVAAMLERVARDPMIRGVIAETAVDNIPSQRALERNGFVRTGTRIDVEDGELFLWRHRR